MTWFLFVTNRWEVTSNQPAFYLGNLTPTSRQTQRKKAKPRDRQEEASFGRRIRGLVSKHAQDGIGEFSSGDRSNRDAAQTSQELASSSSSSPHLAIRPACDASACELHHHISIASWQSSFPNKIVSRVYSVFKRTSDNRLIIPPHCPNSYRSFLQSPEQLKQMQAAYEAAMKDPEVGVHCNRRGLAALYTSDPRAYSMSPLRFWQQAKRIQGMQQAMQNPAYQQQMVQMARMMQDKELQEKMRALKDDPEFAEQFAAAEKEGMAGLMKLMNDETFLRALSKRLGGDLILLCILRDILCALPPIFTQLPVFYSPAPLPACRPRFSWRTHGCPSSRRARD